MPITQGRSCWCQSTGPEFLLISGHTMGKLHVPWKHQSAVLLRDLGLDSGFSLTSTSKHQYTSLCGWKRLQITVISIFSRTCPSPLVQFSWSYPWPTTTGFSWSINIRHGSSHWQMDTQGCGQPWSNNKPPHVGATVLLLFRNSDCCRPWWENGTYAGDPSELGLEASFHQPFQGFLSVARGDSELSLMFCWVEKWHPTKLRILIIGILFLSSFSLIFLHPRPSSWLKAPFPEDTEGNANLFFPSLHLPQNAPS